MAQGWSWEANRIRPIFSFWRAGRRRSCRWQTRMARSRRLSRKAGEVVKHLVEFHGGRAEALSDGGGKGMSLEFICRPMSTKHESASGRRSRVSGASIVRDLAPDA